MRIDGSQSAVAHWRLGGAGAAAALLLAAALACNLPGGGQSPSTVEPTPLTQPTASPTAEAPTAVVDPRILCPAEGPDTTLYISPANGLCFLYPSHYELRQDFERPQEVATLIGPLADPQAMETIALMLSVAYNGPADDMLPEQYADRWLEIHQAPPDVPAYGETIGGQPAWVLNGLPGFGLERRAFVIANEARYTVSLIPVPEDVPALTDEANLAWATVAGSLVFFPPQGEHQYVRAEQVCPDDTAESRLYVSLRDGYCLLYPVDFDPDPTFPGSFTGGPVVGIVEGWGEVRTSLTFGTFGAFPGSTAREVLAPRLDLIDAGSVQDATIGGAQAVVFRDARGPWASRQAMIIYRGFVYTIVAQPWEPERFPSGIEYLDRVWDTVTQSVAFFDRWN